MGKKKTRTEKRRKSLPRRIVRGILLLILASLLYNIIGGYAPFAAPSREVDEAAIQARAAEMYQDIDSVDRAAILEHRDEALNERIRLINQAKEEIILTTYECREGKSALDLVAALLRRADEGVRVRILIDGISGSLFLARGDLFRAAAVHDNIEVHFYNPPKPLAPGHSMGRMHDKYLIADDTAFILGGRNTLDSFLGSYPAAKRSRDREALVYNTAHGTPRGEDSAIHQVRAYFEEVWALSSTVNFDGLAINPQRRQSLYDELNQRCDGLRDAAPELFEPADYAAMTVETHGVWLISNPTGIYAKRPVVFSQLCALMSLAERDIVLHSPYAVLDDAMQARLTEIAAKTPVTLMVNAVENGNNWVASGDYLYHKPQVLSTGMRVLEYAGGDSYHGKSCVIDDDISIIGSYNLDLRSTFVDTELMLVLRSRELNAELRENMAALHADCRQVGADGEGTLPEGLEIPPMPLWQAALLRLIGALMQPVRNLV